MKKNILFLFLLLPFGHAYCQFVNTGLDISNNSVITIQGDFTNQGKFVNSGEVNAAGNWVNQGSYPKSNGKINFNGINGQTITVIQDTLFRILFSNGGQKTLIGNLVVEDSLVLRSGNVVADTVNRLILLASGKIFEAGANSFVNGTIYQTGTGDKFFPIGSSLGYLPVTLKNIKGTNPVTGMLVNNGPNLLRTGAGLKTVSKKRFWQKHQAGGQFVGARISLPVIAEDDLGAFSNISVGASNSLTLPLEDLGQTSFTGNYANGTVESNNFIDFKVFALASRIPGSLNLDSLALVNLYNSTAGASWKSKTNWLTGRVNTWQGVKVAGNRVVEVLLPANNLVGSLNSSIGDLQAINRLVINGNAINGALPISMGQFSVITDLKAHQNKLSGNLPADLSKLDSVRFLELNDNLITGSVPVSFNNLKKLVELRLQNNRIQDLALLSFSPNLLLFQVQNNRLTFEDIIPNIAIAGFNYFPQDSTGLKRDTVLNADANLSLLHKAGVTTNTTFQWLKNGQTIAGATGPSFAITSVKIADEGSFVVRATNSQAPGLILFSKPVFLIVSSRSADSLALISFFNSTAGASWTSRTNWLTGPINTWQGVRISNNRVSALNLPSNNLNGALPDVLGKLVELKSINLSSNKISGGIDERLGNLKKLDTLVLSNNKITLINSNVGELVNLKYIALDNNTIGGGVPVSFASLGGLKVALLDRNQIVDLPNLTALSQITQLRVSNNRLTFEDLEANATIPGILYSPQDSVGVSKSIIVSINKSALLEIQTGGTANAYAWFKNKKVVAGVNTPSYLVNNVNRNTVGKYYASVTNSKVPNLTLFSKVQRLDAKIKMSGNVLSAAFSNVNKGEVYVFEVGETIPFDTVFTFKLNTNNTFKFDSVLLRDYLMLANPDTTNFKSLLPTYFGDVIYWDETDTLKLQGDSLNIKINTGGIPPPTVGPGKISGTLELPEDPGQRIMAGARVANAGVSLRRRSTSQKTLAGKNFVLVAFTRTDAQGNFKFENLPLGEYRIKIEFPGVPMDTTTNIKLNIVSGDDKIEVKSEITPQGIKVAIQEPTGLREIEISVLNIYPNPAFDRMVIKLGTKLRPKQAIIYDLTGVAIKVIRDLEYFDGDKVEINVSDLKSGEYLIYMHESQRNSTYKGSGKFVIMK